MKLLIRPINKGQKTILDFFAFPLLFSSPLVAHFLFFFHFISVALRTKSIPLSPGGVYRKKGPQHAHSTQALAPLGAQHSTGTERMTELITMGWHQRRQLPSPQVPDICSSPFNFKHNNPKLMKRGKDKKRDRHAAMAQLSASEQGMRPKPMP